MSRQELQDHSLRVYISGGPNRQKFSNGMTQHQMADKIESDFPWVQVIKGGKSDYIVIDDENTSGPSATALATKGEIITYSDFYRQMKKKVSKSSKKRSVRKHSNKNFHAHAPQLEIEENMATMHLNENNNEAKKHNIVVLFTKYAVYIHLLINDPTNNETHMLIATTVSQIVNSIALQQDAATVKKMIDTWIDYAKSIVQVQTSIKKGKCTTALDAQQQLKMRSNEIIVLFIKSDTNVRDMMAFFAMHDRHAVQMILDHDEDTSQKQNETMAFETFLESCLEFATKWKQENIHQN